eukprot:GHRQ01014177.1.p1 GENE.GHRQ01014177.1~~GHRQ01014177.1.p1  ORF type:complete len:134 (-),score=26.18 GHRQ01014177.1:536-937(-)
MSHVYSQQRAVHLADAGNDDTAATLPSTLLDDPAYKLVYSTVKADITRKGERSTTVDPQRNTIQDTYTRDEFEKLMGAMLAEGTPAWDRALAMGAWAHNSVGRSDDVRLFYMADLIAPQHIPAVGKWLLTGVG